MAAVRTIKEELHDVPLSKLSTFRIQGIFNKVYKQSKVRAVHTLTILRQVFRQAVKARIIPYNPADLIEHPRKQDKDQHLWNLEQLRTFLDHSRIQAHSY